MTRTPMTVTIKRSEWECYTDTPDTIIETINSYFSYVLSTKDNAFDAQSEIFKFLNMFSEFGFMDSECLECATRVINRYFNSYLSRWSQLGDVTV